MDEEKIVHRRLVTNSQPLFEELKKLGFEEIESHGNKNNLVRRFQKRDKYVTTSHNGLILYVLTDIPKDKDSKHSLQEMKDPQIIHYDGLTVHDEILKFFATRNPTEIKANE